MARLFYKLGVAIISVALFGAIAVGPAMADISVSQNVNANVNNNNSQIQALEQQIDSEVNAGQLSQAQQDLQSLEQMADYAQPATVSAITDLQIALAQAIQSGDWTTANTLFNEIQTLTSEENGSGTVSNSSSDTVSNSSSSTTTTPTEQTQPTSPWWNQQTNQNNSSTSPWWNQQTNQNNSSTHQWSIPKDIDQNNPMLQQPWVQQLLQNNSQASNNSNWWLWQLLRKQHQHK